MKLAFSLLTLAVSAAATKTPKPTLLAHVEVAEDANVDIMMLDDTIVISSTATDKNSMEALMDALEDAQKEHDDHDLIGFYKKLAGNDDVPEDLAKAADKMDAADALSLGDDFGPPPGSHAIGDDGVIVHDDGGDDGDDRRLGFCSGYSACGCYTNLTGNYDSTQLTDTSMWSHLQPYRGTVRHSIYVWNADSWSLAIYEQVSAGNLSKIEAWDTAGRNRYWMATTTDGSGDGYDWRFC